MALATRCPHCQTTFRVAHDQLKLRAGLVRCGACKQIFNGIEHLVPPNEPKQSAAAPSTAVVAEPVTLLKQPSSQDEPEFDATPIESPPPSEAEPDAEPTESTETDEEPDTEPPHSPVDQLTLAHEQAEDDPLQRMTLVNFTDIEDESAQTDAASEKPKIEAQPDIPDPLDEAIEALQRKPLRGTRKSAHKKRHGRREADEADEADEAEAAEFEEPSFVKQGRRQQRVGRALRIFAGIGSIVLLVGVLAQSAYVFRNKIAARFPESKPALAKTCAILGCDLSLPAQIDAVSIESSELQALAPEKNTFALTMLLRNHSETAQAWPNIELTLNDANETAIARRVFTPRDYLASKQDLTEFAPKSEQSFKLFFELSQIKASGYRVYLFYP